MTNQSRGEEEVACHAVCINIAAFPTAAVAKHRVALAYGGRKKVLFGGLWFWSIGRGASFVDLWWFW